MLNVVVLAAGKGTRMKSRRPKVLHKIGGKSLLGHVLETAKLLGADKINLVVGHGAEEIRAEFSGSPYNFVEQTQQLGTGHALQQILPHMEQQDLVLILYGDVPFVKKETLELLISKVSNSLALLTLRLSDPKGYGRILRDNEGKVVAIVEEKDCTDAQRAISEVNTGIMAVSADKLQHWLPKLDNHNAQKEYLLTDIVSMAKDDDVSISAMEIINEFEVLGVNNHLQQAQLERYYQQLQATRLMAAGLTLADPGRFDLRGQLEIGEDVFIDINCVFEGITRLGNGVSVGPNCVIINSTIADDCVIKANSHIENAILDARCEVGPYARLRPNSNLKKDAKVGNFVEIKQATLGEGTKVNHLSYIGDAEIGRQVNVGAGTITCNYDGANKFVTEIGDNAFIGSNTALVAPVKIGAGATVGAGSTITAEVPEDQLALARGRQKNIAHWEKPTKN